jgi:hypothetical protein
VHQAAGPKLRLLLLLLLLLRPLSTHPQALHQRAAVLLLLHLPHRRRGLQRQRLAPRQRGAQQAQRLAGAGGRLQQRVLALQAEAMDNVQGCGLQAA